MPDDLPDDLAQLITLWPALPETIRTTILLLVQSTVNVEAEQAIPRPG